MRLVEDYPTLPLDSGSLWSHSTGGEHATKFFGMHNAVNALSASALTALPSGELKPYSEDEFYDLLMDNQAEVVLVEHIPESSDVPTSLAGLAVGRRDHIGSFRSRTTIERLAVQPDLRGHSIASYMIGKILEHPMATELVVDASNFELSDWFRNKLQTVGFTHTTPDGSPAMWTPGRYPTQLNVSEQDMDQAISQMPNNWYGILNLCSDEEDFDDRREVYRNGAKVGIIRNVPGGFGFDDEIGALLFYFKLFDSEDRQIALLEEVTAREAMINLLNMQGLVTEASL